MRIQDHPENIPAALELDPHEAAKTLGQYLRETTEFQNYLQEIWVINGNLEIQKLLAKMRGQRTALQWKTGDTTPHTLELERLEQELEAHPAYQSFRQAENKVQLLFQAVDRLISQAAGVAFSANAIRRRGCCGE